MSLDPLATNVGGKAPPHPLIMSWDPNMAKTRPLNQEDNHVPQPIHSTNVEHLMETQDTCQFKQVLIWHAKNLVSRIHYG
jgi:hypothetical protein